MSLWGNKDSKTASGTVAIAADGVVTGTNTLFTTQAKIGNYIRVAGEDYEIVFITSNVSAKVIAGVNGAAMTAVSSTASYTLSEKPGYVSHEGRSPFGTSGNIGDSTKVYGVDTTEVKVGSDNVVEVGVANAGTGYVEVPTVTFSGGAGSGAAATATISGGKVTKITVTNVGSAYTSVPTVTLNKPRLTIDTAAVTTGNDTITYTAHGLSTGNALVYFNAGATSIASTPAMVSGTTVVYVNKQTNNVFKLYDTAANAIAGTATGLIDITGTGNIAQYFEKNSATQATAVAVLGENATGGAAHAGWVRRTVGTGGRAGRISYETLVAMGTIASDQSDNIQYPNS